MKDHRTQNLVCSEGEISSLLSERLELSKTYPLKGFSRIRRGDPLLRVLDGGVEGPPLPSNKNIVPWLEDPGSGGRLVFRYGIKPLSEPVRIVAVDVSSVRIGCTEDAYLMAFRGCLVWKNLQKYYFYRYGPLVVMMEDWERGNINGGFQFDSRTISIMRNRVERAIQRTVVEVFKDAVILFDGSLTAGTPDNPSNLLDEIISKAMTNHNLVIGVSKDTHIQVGGRKITELVQGEDRACAVYLDVWLREVFPVHPIHLLGRVYVAKMKRNGLPFRIDVKTLGGIDDDLKAMGLLAGNDLCDHGYPETLRLAHILSSFTSNELVGIRRFTSQRFGLEFRGEHDFRRILFGPFSS